MTSYKHQYEAMKKMVEQYQDELVPGFRAKISELEAKLKEAEPVRHGWWERDEWGSYLRRCSVCKKSPVYQDERGNSVAVYAGVCINCGAKMDGGNNNG